MAPDSALTTDLDREPVRVAVVGAAWRARFFLDLARRLPGVRLVGAVVRRPEVAEQVVREFEVPTATTLGEIVERTRPELVVTAVPWDANPDTVRDAVAAGVRVLAETPPAPDAAGLARLWDDVGSAALVDVAEQYHLMPGHAARRAVVASGAIGVPGQVQVSSTHGYHAVSLIRVLLGVGLVPATVRATTTTAQLADPVTRDGWADADNPHRAPVRAASTTLATIDFGGPSGLYDFTDNQWHNPLRTRRLLVRGSLGELDGDTVTRLAGPREIVTSRIERRTLGHDLNLEGFDTEHLSFEGKVVWRNPFAGLRLSDEEVAIGEILLRSARAARGLGPSPYPLEQACHDHLVSLAIDEAVATGQPVTTPPAPWATVEA